MKIFSFLIAASVLLQPAFSMEGDAKGEMPQISGAVIVNAGEARMAIPLNLGDMKGLDPSSPVVQEEISDRFRKAIEAESPRIRRQVVENQVARYAALCLALRMSPEVFDAVNVLIMRVNNLRMQKAMIGKLDSRDFSPQVLLGDTQLDPSVQEIRDSEKALKALVEDEQANPTELASAVARVRKARLGFDTMFANAQEELRAVLTPRQEAILVDNGTLD